TTFNANITVPPNVLRVGHTYRARVRHRDNTGRYGHWSDPVSFTVTTSNYIAVLKDSLMISEFMYHPAPPNPSPANGRQLMHSATRERTLSSATAQERRFTNSPTTTIRRGRWKPM